MNTNPESSDDERIENLQNPTESKIQCETEKFPLTNSKSTSSEPLAILTEKGPQKLEKLPPDVSSEIDKSLSCQVMEYYHKYSQNSNLNRFFSLPGTDAERHSHSWKAYDKILPRSRQTVATSTENCLDAPKERRRWTRPPLIGQLSGSPGKVIPDSYIERVFSEARSPSPAVQVKDEYLDPEINLDSENSQRLEKSVILNSEAADRDLKIMSPASSSTSHKPLEWDSWADVGYNNVLLSAEKDPLPRVKSAEPVSTHSLCPTSFRLDPEGTPASNVESFNGNPRNSKPDAHSTQLTDDMFNSEDEFKITPIIKTNYSDAIVGNITGDNDILLKGDAPKSKQQNKEELSRKSLEKIDKSILADCKTSAWSKNYLSNPKNPIRRSLSELDLRKLPTEDNKDLAVPFNLKSPCSFRTIANKPILCDKYVQIDDVPAKGSDPTKETPVCSGGRDQGRKINAEEKVKNWQVELRDKATETNKVQNEDGSCSENKVNDLTAKTSELTLKSNGRLEPSERSKNQNNYFSGQQQEIGGRTCDSFQYFPGHALKNFDPLDNTSHVSVLTDRSSTMPNTSSSLDEKLWGHSDSLLHDLERSLTILKSLVNANKCDRKVKKRLIHHVIKRLVTAKYTDDKIECKLEDNVPWNPDNTRNKIYCSEIIKALAKKRNQENSTEESSGNSKRAFSNKGRRNQKSQFINSESSDNFYERITDRTDCMQDGRKARMGLRNDMHCFDYYRRSQKQQEDNQEFQADKTASSDSFLPQLSNLNCKPKPSNGVREASSSGIAGVSARGKTPGVKASSPSTGTTSITTSSNITSGDTTAVTSSTNNAMTVSEKQSQGQDNGPGKKDWRLPSTMSEKRLANEWCSSKLVSATRFIDYVEMEKKNQLVWINSEINHLSSLKKLLEESIESIGRDKEGHLEGKSEGLEDYLERCNLKKNKQWSSHGNLVEKFKVGQKDLEMGSARHAGEGTVAKNCLRGGGETGRSLSGLSSLNSEASRVERNKSERYLCQKQLGFSSESSSQFREFCADDYKKETKNQLNDRWKSDFRITEGEKKNYRDKYYCKCFGASEVVVCCNHENGGKGVGGENRGRDFENEDCDDEKVEKNGGEIGNYFEKNGGEIGNYFEKNGGEIGNYFEKNGGEIGNYFEKNGGEIGNYFEKNGGEIGNNFEKNGKVNRVRCDNCRVCYNSGKENSSGNLMYIKPIAYELSFSRKNQKVYSKTKLETKTMDSSELNCSCGSGNCQCDFTQFHLKDYLKKNKPKFVDNVEMRKRYVSEISQLRLLKKKNRMQLIAPSQPSSSIINQKTRSSKTKSSRKIRRDDEIKTRLYLRRLRSNDIRGRRKQQEKEDRMRRNHLMAKIYCKKLQQKVLEGQVDLSQSVSVISNL